MSVDTTFKPITPTYLVGTSTVQPANSDAARGIVTFRVRCLVAAYLTWGPLSTTAAAGAPAAGTPSVNTIGMSVVGSTTYLEVPAASYFISSVAASFEITGGTGGIGG